MGTTNSKQEPETIVFFNQDVPTRFSKNLVEQLETRKHTSQTHTPHEIDEIVRSRVRAELERLKLQDHEIQERADVQLNNEAAQDSGASAVMTERDVEAMVRRIKRPASKPVPPEIAERQHAVITCYRNNKTRPLDCWEEVQLFKDSVLRAQREFVASHH